MRKEIKEFYNRLYKEEKHWRLHLDIMEFGNISNLDSNWLKRPFEEVEVFEAIKNMNGDKALGPDGFMISFYQKCWAIIKTDLMKVFKEFFHSEDLNGHLNNTFITFIPKKHNDMDMNVKDLRPINLVNSVYKIISKTLTLRLKRVISGIISQPQSAFIVAGRSLMV